MTARSPGIVLKADVLRGGRRDPADEVEPTLDAVEPSIDIVEPLL
jgi:hypothetical protein